MSYAQETSVPVERSRAEIEAILRRYGATSFMSGWQQGRAGIQFEYRGRAIRFVLSLPSEKSHEFDRDGRGAVRSPARRQAAWDQACRSRWRALALVVKAKLEATSAGISSFETEFLPWTVLPNGQTVAEHLEPQIQASIESGQMPRLALGFGGAS